MHPVAIQNAFLPPYEIGSRYIAYAGKSKTAQYNTQLLSPEALYHSFADLH